MEPKQNKPDDKRHELYGCLTRWLHRYMQGREAGPFMLWSAIVVCLGIFLIALVLLFGHFHKQGISAGMWITAGLSGILMIFVILFAVPQWGYKRCEHWSRRLYGRDGEVQPIPERQKKSQWLMAALVLWLFAGIFASVHLEKRGLLPRDYVQPFSTIYVMPVFIFLGLYKPDFIKIKSPLMAIWPMLYAFHAFFVLMNWWPITVIPREHDLFIATFGYGLITAVIIVLYSRYAFYRLKKIARTPIEENRQQNGVFQ
jgi:hypothetical protein